jgi:hypothetical protein
MRNLHLVCYPKRRISYEKGNCLKIVMIGLKTVRIGWAIQVALQIEMINHKADV